MIKQIVNFGIAGVITTIVDIGLYWVLIYIGVDYLLANVLAFSISVILNYILNMRYVFEGSGNAKRDFIIFVSLSIIGLLLNELIVWFASNVLGKQLVKIAATGVVMCYNFISRKLVFRGE